MEKTKDVQVHTAPTVDPDAEEQARQEDAPPAHRNALRTDDWWLWECVGILGSLAALLGIIFTLKALNGKPQPRWAYHYQGDKAILGYSLQGKSVGISVSSLISWMSTIAKICVLIPVTRGLGQLKWVWFSEKERVLSDLETFDSATRGLSGSAMLVWTLRGRHFAVLGALAMVLSLGFEPFIQNLVTYPTKRLPYYSPAKADGTIDYEKTSSWTINTAYDVTDPNPFSETTIPTFMKQNIMDALYSFYIGGGNPPAWMVPYTSCPSGNCTYWTAANIAVDYLCTDLRSTIVVQCPSAAANATENCEFSLPNGLSIGGTGSTHDYFLQMTVVNDTSSYSPIVYKNLLNPVAIIQSIAAYEYSNNDSYQEVTQLKNDTFVMASECAMFPVVQATMGDVNHYVDPSTVTSQGILVNVTVVGSYTNYSWDATNGVLFNPPTDKRLNTTQGQSYTISPTAYQAFQSYFSNLFTGHATIAVNSTTTPNYEGLNNTFKFLDKDGYPSDTLKTMYIKQYQASGLNYTNSPNWYDCAGLAPPFNSAGSYIADQVACTVKFATMAVNKGIRDSVMEIRRTNTASQGWVYGETWLPITIVQVTWAWICLPVLLWMMSTGFIMGVMWRTRKSGVRTWRTNPLAMVFMGLGSAEEEKLRREEVRGMTESALSKRAELLKVRLHVSDRDAKLTSGRS